MIMFLNAMVCFAREEVHSQEVAAKSREFITRVEVKEAVPYLKIAFVIPNLATLTDTDLVESISGVKLMVLN